MKIVNSQKSLLVVASMLILSGCGHSDVTPTNNTVQSPVELPESILLKEIAQNPEGIEYNKDENVFYLSSLNANSVLKVKPDGSYEAFTHGEKFPLSSAGIQIDSKRNRLLVTGFNGTELMDNDANTKGISFLRIYNLTTGLFEKEVLLSSLVPDAHAYFANDVAVDDAGNVYISDWYANVVYKVDLDAKATVFWTNKSGVSGGPNGLDVDADGNLMVSLVSVDSKGQYADFALIKISLDNASNASEVMIEDQRFAGFDGMIVTDKGTIVGVTNDRKTAGGNSLIELLSHDGWRSAEVIHSKTIDASTTVSFVQDNQYFILNQDFTNPAQRDWMIKKIEF